LNRRFAFSGETPRETREDEAERAPEKGENSLANRAYDKKQKDIVISPGHADARRNDRDHQSPQIPHHGKRNSQAPEELTATAIISFRSRECSPATRHDASSDASEKHRFRW
jgi:hypothetical protein